MDGGRSIKPFILTWFTFTLRRGGGGCAGVCRWNGRSRKIMLSVIRIVPNLHTQQITPVVSVCVVNWIGCLGKSGIQQQHQPPATAAAGPTDQLSVTVGRNCVRRLSIIGWHNLHKVQGQAVRLAWTLMDFASSAALSSTRPTEIRNHKCVFCVTRVILYFHQPSVETLLLLLHYEAKWFSKEFYELRSEWQQQDEDAKE